MKRIRSASLLDVRTRRCTRLKVNARSAVLRLCVGSENSQTLGAARNGNTVVERQVLSKGIHIS
jgi:hypothetical protein